MERLTRRNLLGAAGAFAGGSTLAGAAAAMPALKTTAGAGADAELFALLDEEERLWTMVSRTQDEAQRRGRDIPDARVEIGSTNGAPIFVSTEESFSLWFGVSPERAAEIDGIIGRTTVLYRARREEL